MKCLYFIEMKAFHDFNGLKLFDFINIIEQIIPLKIQYSAALWLSKHTSNTIITSNFQFNYATCVEKSIKQNHPITRKFHLHKKPKTWKFSNVILMVIFHNEKSHFQLNYYRYFYFDWSLDAHIYFIKIMDKSFVSITNSLNEMSSAWSVYALSCCEALFYWARRDS